MRLDDKHLRPKSPQCLMCHTFLAIPPLLWQMCGLVKHSLAVRHWAVPPLTDCMLFWQEYLRGCYVNPPLLTSRWSTLWWGTRLPSLSPCSCCLSPYTRGLKPQCACSTNGRKLPALHRPLGITAKTQFLPCFVWWHSGTHRPKYLGA